MQTTCPEPEDVQGYDVFPPPKAPEDASWNHFEAQLAWVGQDGKERRRVNSGKGKLACEEELVWRGGT